MPVPRSDIRGGPLTPFWVAPMLRPFGTNPFGENLFRLVFSTRRTFTVGGYWETDGRFQYRTAPRYPKKRCWVLEKWLPARHYGSPVSWNDDTINPEGYLSLGPYPLYGVFECCFMFAQGIAIRQDILMGVLKTVWTGRTRKVSDIREQLAAEIKAEDLLWDEQFERDYDATHGVRRGLSLTGAQVLQYHSDDIEKYKEKIIASGVRLQRDDFKEGFQQFQNEGS